MNCHIIDRILSPEEIKLLNQSKDDKVFYTSMDLSNQYPNGKLIAGLSEIEKRDINYNILQEILNVSSLKYEGQPILEYLKIGNFNLWFYHKFRLYFDIRNAFFEIEKIKKTENQYEQVVVLTDSGFINAFTGFKSTTKIYFAPTKAKLDKVSLVHFLLTSALRLLRSWLVFKSYNDHKLIVDNRDHYKSMTAVSGSEEVFENNYLGYLFDKAEKEKIALLDVLPIPKFDGEKPYRLKWKSFINISGRKRIYEEKILFNGFFNSKLRKQRVSDGKILLEKLNLIPQSVDLNPIQQLIFWSLKNLHKSTMLYYFKHLAYSNYFQNNEYPLVASIDEYSANVKLIHDAAKANAMESIGIQHGTMHELHPGYVYSKEEALTKPFPDKTLLWGERWKIFLIEKGNYPVSSLSVSGQIRTDVIHNLISKKEEIKKQIGLPEKKILLFASQPQRDPILRAQTSKDIFEAVKDFENVLLILKPHPLETDLDYFKSKAKTVNCENYKIITDVDLYQLLTVSDYVITSFSTVGTEAVYFEKPLIIYDPLDQDVMQYVEDGVGIQAKNSDEVRDVLRQLEDKKLTIEMSDQKQFISSNAFEIDGNVCERILGSMKS